jgi:hypothetical protein
MFAARNVSPTPPELDQGVRQEAQVRGEEAHHAAHEGLEVANIDLTRDLAPEAILSESETKPEGTQLNPWHGIAADTKHGPGAGRGDTEYENALERIEIIRGAQEQKVRSSADLAHRAMEQQEERARCADRERHPG